jgi:Ner family transcriptional regulator
MTMPRDWHREKIKAEIRMRGTTLRALSLPHSPCRNAVAVALARPWPKIEAVVAAFLGVPAQTIWPSRYDAFGQPTHGHYAGKRKPSANTASKNRQKRKAA